MSISQGLLSYWFTMPQLVVTPGWVQGQLTLTSRMDPLALSPAKALRGTRKANSNGDNGQQSQSGSSSMSALAGSQLAGQQQGGSSTDVGSNPWHVLWATTPACPAWEQKPLQVCCKVVH
jgi:hypothetical protein